MKREIKSSDIVNVVEGLCIKANTILRPDIARSLEELYQEEQEGSISKNMLGILVENAQIAEKEKLAICQDTGLVCVFVDMGEDVVVSGNITSAINSGVEEAYRKGLFRKSVVEDPIKRNNTGTNTPAVVHINIVPGDKIKISVLPKGFGSENKSRIKMLNPTCGIYDIVDFCVSVVKEAGADACPPYVLGIGIGGTMDQCAALAKKALLRPIDEPNNDEEMTELEAEIKREANSLDIGIMGLGGKSTVMGVNIEKTPTHIAGLPVAVNISCHALRSASGVV